MELWVENLISEMKNILDRIHNRVNTVDLNISKFEAIETIQIRADRKKT